MILPPNNAPNKLPVFYTGTSGLQLPVKNKLFYPEEFQDKSSLCFYSSLLNTIEINSSFYKVPLISTVAKWAMTEGKTVYTYFNNTMGDALANLSTLQNFVIE